MTKVNHFKYATPRNQRVREFVRHKMGVAFLFGFVSAIAIEALFVILKNL